MTNSADREWHVEIDYDTNSIRVTPLDRGPLSQEDEKFVAFAIGERCRTDASPSAQGTVGVAYIEARDTDFTAH